MRHAIWAGHGENAVFGFFEKASCFLEAYCSVMPSHCFSTVQRTDGGPSVAPELPSCVAGPPFGAAPGSVGFSKSFTMLR